MSININVAAVFMPNLDDMVLIHLNSIQKTSIL